MKISHTIKFIMKILMPLLFTAFYAVYATCAAQNPTNLATIDRLSIVTDESWEVSKGQPKFGQSPLSMDAILATKTDLKGGNTHAVVANYYGASTLVDGAKPIWLTRKASDDFESRQFKKVFMLRNNVMSAASFKINCDDAARVYINGQLVAKGLSGDLKTGYFRSTTFQQLTAYFYDQIYTYDVKPFLVAGALNTVLIEVASESVSDGHAYVSARLDVNFIEKTAALQPAAKPAVKPSAKPEKKPMAVVKKPTEKKVVPTPKKEVSQTDPSVQTPDNEPIKTSVPIISDAPTVFKTSTDIDVRALKIGDIFELGNIYFRVDTYALNAESEATLVELATFLKANKDVKIEIGGHTNLLPTNEYAYKLSSERAKSVMDFLTKNGVPQSRLLSKGYGKSKPKLVGKTSMANQKNQRVEVKILAK